MDAFFSQLQQATQGLIFPSESDEPVTPVSLNHAGPLTLELVAQLTGKATRKKPEVQTLEEFFAPAVKEQDWFEEEERQRCRRFQQLQRLLQSSLHDAHVYRFGSVEIDVYVLGVTPQNTIAGIQTRIIET